MDVTILIAPKGCTRNPVAFKPSVHVYTVPDGVDVEFFVQNTVSQLSASYHNGVYSAEFFNEPCAMDEFREYVKYREAARCERVREHFIRKAYDEVVKIYMGKDDFSEHRARLNHLLRGIMPGIDNRFCRWILCQSATSNGFVSLDDFSEIIREAESIREMQKNGGCTK